MISSWFDPSIREELKTYYNYIFGNGKITSAWEFDVGTQITYTNVYFSLLSYIEWQQNKNENFCFYYYYC